MDVRGQRILIFGDSLSKTGSDNSPEIAQITTGSNRQSGQPGDLLGSMLLEHGAEAVQVDARVSRSAANFFGREAAQALLNADAAFRPSIVIVILGTNDIGLNLTADAQAFEQIKAFFESTGAQVWAIGPFTYNQAALNIGADPVAEMMRNVFSPRFIDGRPLSVQEGRAGDGVHFGAQSAAITAANMLQAILDAGVFLGVSKSSWLGIGLGAVAVLGGALAYQWWRRRSPKLMGPDDGFDETEDDMTKDLFGLNATKMAIGTLVHRAGAPDELYRVTDSPTRGVFRLLPHQRQGQEVMIFGKGSQWDDGISQFLIQDVEYVPKAKAAKPKRKTLAQRKADHEAANTETSEYVKRTFGPKDLKGSTMLYIWRKKSSDMHDHVSWEQVRDTTPENADAWLASKR